MLNQGTPHLGIIGQLASALSLSPAPSMHVVGSSQPSRPAFSSPPLLLFITALKLIATGAAVVKLFF